jgi:hypothetical protein
MAYHFSQTTNEEDTKFWDILSGLWDLQHGQQQTGFSLIIFFSIVIYLESFAIIVRGQISHPCKTSGTTALTNGILILSAITIC